MIAPRSPSKPHRLAAGDLVVRRVKALTTRGTVLRFDGIDKHGGVRAWIKWDHATTLPNPSLEAVDELERVRPNRVLSERGE